MFILCTTESHKIPATIVSRCQQFSFRSVDFAQLGGAHAMDRQARRHHGRCGNLQRARAGRRRQRSRFALRSRSGHRLLRNGAESHRSPRPAGHVLARFAGRRRQRHWSTPIRKRCSMWWRISKRTAAACSISRASWRAISAILLVVKISRGVTKLVAASPPEQETLGKVAAQFSEEDLTRYLRLDARPVSRFAELAAAAAASRTRAAAAGARGQVAVD